jgi:type III secretion protein V
LAAALGFVAYRLMKPEAAPRAAAARETSTSPAGPTGGKTKGREFPAPLLNAIGVDLAPAVASVMLAAGEASRLTAELAPALRERLFQELGVPVPAVRVRPNVSGLGVRGYAIRLQEVSMGRGEVVPGGGLSFERSDRLAELGLVGSPGAHPDGTPGIWLPPDQLAAAQAAGVTTLAAEEVIMAHLLLLLRKYAFEFVGIQETQGLLELIERTHPALVREVVPKLVSPTLLADVLKRLVEEGVSLRSLREILGALAEWAPHERDPIALTEHVRQALRRQIGDRYTSPNGTLAAYLLDPMIEETVREAIHRTATGSYLALEPALSRDIIQAVGRSVPKTARVAVILTNADIRRYVRRLVETEHPQVAVLSYQELAPEIQIQPAGRIRV